ncbi:AraC family transcriptional regulator [Sphingomonas sp. BIUV-7]|uniref:AraC family transcriptional regulator n=1 Tax=Sphingomonas natans TaxID=3063330 RepID=A0ABT8Y7A6_9SPHN|nr:AraC family transcriptional regulator [Sphingomonas sp. BIUV-7]MDO6414204.1 AraC family transcriptional regulator [Sphingomonas sp. BIUV-7]
MLSNTMERTQPGTTALPPYLLDLVGQARRSVEIDPDFTRRCLEEISSLLTSVTSAVVERGLAPSGPATPAGTLAKGGLASWQIQRVRAYVEEQLDNTVLIEDLAGVAKLSPGHFCRAFKASTGETPHGYIVRQRLRRAQTLMLNTNDTLSQIACACGLTDQAHLTRLFRRMLNETPLSWRRNWRFA